MKTTTLCTLVSLLALLTIPVTAKDETSQVKQAAAIIQRFKSIPEKEIPREVLRDAKGLAILTVTKGGFVISGKYGEGVILARTPTGWSGPAFIRTGGIGVGPQIGGSVTEFVLVLNTPDAVTAFAKGTNVQLGGAISVAAGPAGRSVEAGVMPKAAVYSYSVSQGLFAGVSLEGTIIKSNPKGNERYYNAAVSVGDILKGRVTVPSSAAELRKSL